MDKFRLLEGKIAEARKLAHEAYRLAPDSRMVLEVLTRILNRQGEKEIVQKLLHQIESPPDQTLPWMDPYAEQALAFSRFPGPTLIALAQAEHWCISNFAQIV